MENIPTFAGFLRWSFKVFRVVKITISNCDLSDYYCPYDWSRHIMTFTQIIAILTFWEYPETPP